MRSKLAALASLTVLIPATAWAHPGHDNISGFSHGLAHPLTGVDHILAMIAVGILAARIGGRARWLLPSAFISTMAAAAALGMVDSELPWIEVGIAGSLIVFGVAVACSGRLSSALAACLIVPFAACHGYAHGVEIPAGVSGLSYAAGFLTATGLLIGAGAALVTLVSAAGDRIRYQAVQVGGAAIGLYGLALLPPLL